MHKAVGETRDNARIDATAISAVAMSKEIRPSTTYLEENLAVIFNYVDYTIYPVKLKLVTIDLLWFLPLKNGSPVFTKLDEEIFLGCMKFPIGLFSILTLQEGFSDSGVTSIILGLP